MNIDFEKSIERLNQIVKEFKLGKLSLDESLVLFEEGTSIINDCNKAINEAEQKITILKNDTEDIFENYDE